LSNDAKVKDRSLSDKWVQLKSTTKKKKKKKSKSSSRNSLFLYAKKFFFDRHHSDGVFAWFIKQVGDREKWCCEEKQNNRVIIFLFLFSKEKKQTNKQTNRQTIYLFIYFF
jgi:hypothetical protein